MEDPRDQLVDNPDSYPGAEEPGTEVMPFDTPVPPVDPDKPAGKVTPFPEPEPADLADEGVVFVYRIVRKAETILAKQALASIQKILVKAQEVNDTAAKLLLPDAGYEIQEGDEFVFDADEAGELSLMVYNSLPQKE